MEKKRKGRVALKKSWLIVGGVVLLAGGFALGTRASMIEARLAPLFGYNRSAETIDLSSVQRTYQYLVANFDGSLDSQKLIEGANHGLVAAAGDKYTMYLTSEEAKEFGNDLSGNVGAGIGAQIEERNDRITLGRILPDNPADAGGLKQGDIVESVNDQPTTGWDVDKAVAAIKGDVGTSVKLVIKRGDETLPFTLTRAIINNPSVLSAVQDGIGIMTISRFDDQTGALAEKAAQNFKRDNVRGVIIDIRSDGGGYIDAAVDVASIWLKNKTVVTQRINGKIVDTRTTGSTPTLEGLKTYILVNGGSASASEILASSLRDHHAAQLIGEKTFGKGSVQQVLDVGGGAQLKVTVAKWYTPDNLNVSGKGLAPDVAVALTQADIDTGRDPQLDAAKKLLTAQ